MLLKYEIIAWFLWEICDKFLGFPLMSRQAIFVPLNKKAGALGEVNALFMQQHNYFLLFGAQK